MKKYWIRTPLLAGLATLLLALPIGKQDGLKEIVKPYLGEYECVEAKLNSMDYLERFSSVSLELRKDGEFILYYQESGAKKHKIRGQYRYDAKKESIVFSSARGAFQREFPLKQGVLTISFPVHGDIVVLKFTQK